MAKQIVVVVAHTLGADEAIEAIHGQMPHIQAAFGKFAKLQDVKWQGNALTYNVSAFGVSAPGSMAVYDDRIEVTADLPAILAPFAQLVENAIRRHATDIFDRRKDAREVAVLARSTAEAAGRRWGQLTDDERRSYREEARRQLRSGA